jgi:hypothetical protein
MSRLTLQKPSHLSSNKKVKNRELLILAEQEAAPGEASNQIMYKTLNSEAEGWPLRYKQLPSMKGNHFTQTTPSFAHMY